MASASSDRWTFTHRPKFPSLQPHPPDSVLVPNTAGPFPSPLATYPGVSVVRTANHNNVSTGRKRSSHSWDFLLCDVQPFPETIEPKNRNCLDSPSSQHNDSMAAAASLEAAPGTLKPRNSSVEMKEALPGPPK